MDRPQSGRRGRTGVAVRHIMTVREGKVVRTENYGTVEKALEAAGLRG